MFYDDARACRIDASSVADGTVIALARGEHMLGDYGHTQNIFQLIPSPHCSMLPVLMVQPIFRHCVAGPVRLEVDFKIRPYTTVGLKSVVKLAKAAGRETLLRPSAYQPTLFNPISCSMLPSRLHPIFDLALY